ncbi:alkaline shock response membrane anchor protein AmaP, partial [Streptomyces sp. SID6041]|nr:alkaline shock response membrane anchor protein AmaP [Streptomyces sp. SID6041]
MRVVLRRVNRLLLGLAGLVLLLLGGGVLAAALDLSVPSWWPWSGPSDVLLSTADRQRWRSEGWWWPVVIAVLGLVVLLALWWLLAQFRRARLAEVVV